MKALDLINKQFGKLLVLQRHPENNKFGKSRWICKCSCGTEITVDSGNLTSGHTRSCGCLVTEHCKTKLKASHSSHGLSKTPEYETWLAIRKRCHDESAKDYYRYGGRGIAVCERWRESFEAFYQDMGPRPSPDHSIDRKDNNAGYSPNNCRWATKEEQANNRSTNVTYLIDGESLTLAQIARLHQLNPATIKKRLKCGKTITEAIEPVNRPMYTYDGEIRSLASWANILGFNEAKARLRLSRGWSFEKAIED